MRATTAAVLLFTANIANLAIAPQMIGFASDFLAGQIADPAQSLRIALAISGLTGIWAAIHFWLAIRSLPDDLVRAGTRSEEHTSELQSLMRNSYAVFCLQKQKNHTTKPTQN